MQITNLPAVEWNLSTQTALLVMLSWKTANQIGDSSYETYTPAECGLMHGLHVSNHWHILYSLTQQSCPLPRCVQWGTFPTTIFWMWRHFEPKTDFYLDSKYSRLAMVSLYNIQCVYNDSIQSLIIRQMSKRCSEKAQGNLDKVDGD